MNLVETNNTEILSSVVHTAATIPVLTSTNVVLNGGDNAFAHVGEPNIVAIELQKEVQKIEPELESALEPSPMPVQTVSDNYEILMPKSYWETLKTEMADFGLTEAVQPTDFVNFLVTRRDILKNGQAIPETMVHRPNQEDYVNKRSVWQGRIATFFMCFGIATFAWVAWLKIQRFRNRRN